MTRIGYFLSSEEFAPGDLLRQAQLAEQAGFEALWISDHYHPWLEEQGNSPFVWSVIGALSQVCSLPVTTAVTCPTLRIHPAVIAQAAATCAVLHEGRFSLGVGSGEALNEHIFGDPWPEAGVRIEMLEEAVEVMRKLWQGGQQSHRGRHYTVENAQVWTLPDEPPPVLVSGFGPRSVDLAARIGDGYCLAMPDADLVSRFRSGGGGEKPVQSGTKVCWAQDEATGRQTAHRRWRNEGLPGELAQVLPTTEHFQQASELVTEAMIGDAMPCGPDPERHRQALQAFFDAGVDEVYVQQIGPEQEGFFSFFEREVLPGLH